MGEFDREAVRDPRVQTVVTAIKTDLSKPWTAREMARLVNLSVSRFAHIFVEEVGQTPARFLLDARLTEAHRLLSKTFMTVKEVSTQVGFSDRSYFNRAFKRHFGCTPGAAKRAP